MLGATIAMSMKLLFSLCVSHGKTIFYLASTRYSFSFDDESTEYHSVEVFHI